MTAVVGILNRQAVAIAADSAVTVNGKITNRALKIFTLSKYHPVGVMIYNLGEFNAVTWEVIIKIYRKQLRNKSFPKVKDYQEDFIKFLHTKKFFTNLDFNRNTASVFCDTIISELIKEVFKGNEDLAKDTTEEGQAKIMQLFEAKAIQWEAQFIENYKVTCPEFNDYTKAEFCNFFDAIFEQVVIGNFTNKYMKINDKAKEAIKNTIYVFVKAKENYINYTGIVFVGFGEDEIYPSLIPVNVSFPVENRLRYYIDETNLGVITNEIGRASSINPFAQTEAMNTILMGISPKLETTYMENFKFFVEKYNKQIIDMIGEGQPELIKKIEGFNTDDLINGFREKNKEAKNANYIYPLMDAVASLSKEDLAEMAESLIYLTYLQKRITLAAEDVGGTVDVAIITKGDGFIWIKRKHYFNPELNRHFFSNYFNK